MRHFVLLLCLFLCGMSAGAQTIIDLSQGGKLRAKTVEDYALESRVRQRIEADSLAYRDCLTRAFNALHADSLDAAASLFEQALKLRPDAPGNNIVQQNLGRICMARGNWKGAVERFSNVLKKEPEHHDARFDRATAFLEAGNAREVLTDCNVLLSAANLEEDLRKRTLFLRAAAYMELRLYRDARTDLEEVMRLEPANPNAPLLLAAAYERDGRPQEALTRLTLYINAHPESPEALAMRGELEAKAGMLEAARADYDEALKLDKQNPRLFIARADILLRLGLKAAARRDLDEAVRLGIARASLKDFYDNL